MNIAELWDHAWWGFMIAIAVGLVWLKFLDPVVPCVGPGLVVALILGGAYFYRGFRKMRQAQRAEKE